ncbi:F-box/LRR-repeat protein 6, partial [Zerene cesonia]|uniref:F-box/LRR-repeat protein 6 n=1 Tax=Zerene cesonia TaxID=33412 RepID=UPI0018E57B1D
MSGHSSPLNGGYDAAEPAMRLSVRKDLFPDERLPKIVTNSDSDTEQDQLEDYSCVKLETDFEQSIDDIANQKMQVVNGIMPNAPRSRHKKHKQRSRRDSDQSTLNGYLPSERKRKKHSRSSRSRTHKSNSVVSKIKGGKNLNLVSSSECQEDEDEEDSDAESESSEDEVLQSSVKLKFLPRQSGKPYSHELSQLSTKKNKSKDSSKEQRTHVVIPCSGKPRSMLGLCSSRSKKKSKKPDHTPTYRSQIVDTSTKLKIKIKRTGVQEAVSIVAPTPALITDIAPRKSKKKRAASPAPSVSSGEEYDPSRGDTASAMSVAAPKSRQSRQKAPRKSNNNTKSKAQKTEKSRSSAAESRDAGPQSPWATSMPEEILMKIFEYVVIQQGTLPAIVRLSSVCKFWYSVSCKPEFWRNVDLAQYTVDKCKTDYKLVWLLENRLSQCQSLNIAQWDVCNVTWVLTCLVDYCPDLVELGVAGWSRITPEQLFDLIQGLPKLQRIDLSSLSELGSSSTCLSAASVARIMENFGDRLTHLTLANNKFSALQQILTSVATYCPNLEVLDISGALATSHPAAVPLEALQKGCPKLRVFRAANAQLVLASATTSQQSLAHRRRVASLSVFYRIHFGECAAELHNLIPPSPFFHRSSRRTDSRHHFMVDVPCTRTKRQNPKKKYVACKTPTTKQYRKMPKYLSLLPATPNISLVTAGCNVTRQRNACLELICEKWSHSLIELDLSWASANKVLDDAVAALADAASSKLRILNLFGSSVSLEPVKKVLLKCSQLESLNLSLCRALPRGMKRLYTGKELQDLKDSFNTDKVKKEDNKGHENKKAKKSSKAETSKSEDKKIENSDSVSESSSVNLDIKSPESKSSSCVF